MKKVENPVVLMEKGTRHVARGGGWFINARGCRAASRSRFDATGRFGGLGFRLRMATISSNLKGEQEMNIIAKVRGYLSDPSMESWAQTCLLLESLHRSDSLNYDLCYYIYQHTSTWEKSWLMPLYEWWYTVVHTGGSHPCWWICRNQEAWLPTKGTEAGETRIVPGVPDMVLLWVPPGEFVMGSSEDDMDSYADERPQRLVKLTRGFWMAQTPTTQDQFETVMGHNPSHFKHQNNPVENVSWHQSVAMAQAMSSRFSLEGIFDVNGETSKIKDKYNSQSYYKASGFSLPTEAEWEYACRATTTTPRYGDLDDIAWHSGNSRGTTHPVKEKTPNKWGFYDMLGNVWEWTCNAWKS
jgi:formylglycine-generating enzyme required for sulfatase activity